jgi:hypothetical protein
MQPSIVKDQITCFLMINNNVIIGRLTRNEIEAYVVDPVVLSFKEVPATDGTKGVTVIPWFTPLNQFGQFIRGEQHPLPNFIMFPYPASPGVAADYASAIDRIAADAAGLITPTAQEKGAILSTVKGGKRRQ